MRKKSKKALLKIRKTSIVTKPKKVKKIAIFKHSELYLFSNN